MLRSTSLERRIAQVVLDRGISRNSMVLVLMQFGFEGDCIPQSAVHHIFDELSIVPPDVPKSVAFTLLCACKGEINSDDEKEMHKMKCKFVRYCDLIDEPLSSIYD